MKRRTRIVECLTAGLLSVVMMGTVASGAPVGNGEVDPSAATDSQNALSQSQATTDSSSKSQSQDDSTNASTGIGTQGRGDTDTELPEESAEPGGGDNGGTLRTSQDKSVSAKNSTKIGTQGWGDEEPGFPGGGGGGDGEGGGDGGGSMPDPDDPLEPSDCPAFNSPMPDHIVNGDFEYPNFSGLGTGVYYSTMLDPVHKYFAGVNGTELRFPFADYTFCRSRFGWSSTERAVYPDNIANWQDGMNIEIQKFKAGGNQHAEINAKDAQKAIYQDISTVPGAIYKWRLKHASRYYGSPDTMNVLIGSVDWQGVQNATRVTTNGAGDQLGWVGPSITTKNPYGVPNTQSSPKVGYESAFETYEGTYTVPENQYVTRFTFKAVNAYTPSQGNVVDDISFKVMYPLSYNLNGGNGTTPASVNKDADEWVQLPTAGQDSDSWDSGMVTGPDNARFVGWSTAQHGVFTNPTAAQNATISWYQMTKSRVTMYAVWVASAAVFYNPNEGGIGQPPDSSGRVVDVGSTHTVEENRFTRDNARFLNWNTQSDGRGMSYIPGKTLEVPAGGLTLYAQWQETGWVKYNANANEFTGSMSNSSVMDAGTQYQLAANEFKRPGLVFKEWNTQKDGKGTSYPANGSLSINKGENNLYAIWVLQSSALPLTGVPWELVVLRVGGCALAACVLLLACHALERRYLRE